MIRRIASVLLLLVATLPAADNQPPQIKHAAVTKALQGQGIVVRATVTDDARSVRSVTLYYALTKDMAPYKVDMQDSGSGLFTGTIPADLLSGNSLAYYYIEAKDVVGAIKETEWFTVEIKSGKGAVAPPSTGGTTTPTESREGGSWVKPALIGVGIVAAGALAVSLSNSGGSDDDDDEPPAPDPGDDTNDVDDVSYAGTYAGSATTCFAPPGEASSCSLSAITITVNDSGQVTSDSLRPGELLSTTLSGNDFLFIAPVSEPDMAGQIEYLGSIVGERISGSIQGTVTSTNGAGTYSGNFNAVRQ